MSLVPKFSREELLISYANSETEYKARKRDVVRQTAFLSSVERKAIDYYNGKNLNDTKKHLDVLDYSRLQHLLEGKFYSPYVMALFARILVAIYQKENLQNLNLENIRYWLEGVEQLSSGVYGVTLEATLRGMLSPQVVIKYPKQDNLTHEIFVGLYGTNILRQFIPNFSFVYGGFRCTGPVLLGNRALDFCNKPLEENADFDYALYENVTPSLTFDDALPNLSGEEFLNLYFILILALQVAYERVRFTHFDLHGKNVLLRELEEEVIIPYPTALGTFYIRTKYIPTLIDYGRSSITHKDVVYSVPGMGLFLGLGDVSSFPLYDAYRLITFLFVSSNATPEQRQVAKNIIEFFTPLPEREVAQLALDTYSALPTYMSSFDLSSLINHLYNFAPTCIVPEPDEKSLFSCANQTCFGVRDLKRQLYLTAESKANSLFSLYFLLQATTSPDRPAGQRRLLQSYPEYKIIRDVKRLEKKASRYLLLERNVPSFTVQNLSSPATYASFYYIMEYIVKLRKLYRRILETKNILIYLAPYYKSINVAELERIENISSFNYNLYLTQLYQALIDESDSAPYLQLLSVVADYVNNY
ncbi:protein kinase [Cedratvirus lausannensis]|uniref:Protein kinase n=1 Tax=Cedratvirus lausannensis TaxID=2023205 RepID=A0A285PXI6_9VIRU|nr:protein kinase [Cedratvirus lausannensis]